MSSIAVADHLQMVYIMNCNHNQTGCIAGRVIDLFPGNVANIVLVLHYCSRLLSVFDWSLPQCTAAHWARVASA